MSPVESIKPIDETTDVPALTRLVKTLELCTPPVPIIVVVDPM